MMKFSVFSLLMIAILVSPGCRKVFQNDGPLAIEFREVDTNYNKLYLEGSMDVIIVQNPEFTVKVEAGQRLIPFIETRVFEDQLHIYEESNNIYHEEPVRVFISKEFLEDIELDGSGDVTASGLIAGHANLEINGSGDMDIQYAQLETSAIRIDGSGDVRVTGNSEQLNIHIDGSGDIDARYLSTETCFISVNGSGDSRVTVNEYLNVDIDGSGDVLYWGDPNDVDAVISGSGDLINMD